MTQVCVFTSSNSVGVTFLEWSTHYLNGKNSYFHLMKNQNLDLVKNPLTGCNAHNHDKCETTGFNEVKLVLEKIKKTELKDLTTFYANHPRLNNVIDLLQTTDEKKLSQFFIDDYTKTVNEILSNNLPLVYIYTDPSIVGYFNNKRTYQTDTIKSDKEIDSFVKAHVDLEHLFFSENKFNSIGEKREIDALDIRPFTNDYIFNINLKQKHAWYNCKNVWADTEDVMVDIFKFLGLRIDKTRMDNWLPISHKWQKIHNKINNFYNNLDHIVDCIVNGYYYEIGDITYEQEVIILHLLIYKHNLNLKIVDKFPNNTADFDKLLTENFHTIDDIY